MSEQPPSDDDNAGQITSLSSYLDELCPYAMLWGMTYDEFWHGDLERLFFYEQYYKMHMEQTNQMMWYMGAYVREAIASALDKKNKYPNKPHRITPQTEAEKREEQKANNSKLREYFNNLKSYIDAKRGGA